MLPVTPQACVVEVVGLEPTRSEETRFTVWRANQLLNTSFFRDKDEIAARSHQATNWIPLYSNKFDPMLSLRQG